ncbi:MAG: threonylcarbamoyl-AMP synthase [Propionibacteriaceae bacterium]|jgi:tRNA threonylcarbamoyl adenosine modification protein (Sua5/YciO/YrdC/YwlC family)|nr:threonylcarbamoyl-AMP synthase [Propionibacteriaceae bacterium]
MPRTVDAMNEPQEAIQAAVAVIRAGGLVVLPTDTVYGIGADPFQPAAVQALLDAKGRGRDMPPPVLVAQAKALFALTKGVSAAADALTAAFWPGALTLVMNANSSLRMDLGDRGGTIAVRVPDHRFARDLLRITGPLAVSSANLAGHPAATDVDTAIGQLGDRVDLYLDFGSTPGLEASTIVDLTGSTPRILRQGLLSAAELGEVVAIDG